VIHTLNEYSVTDYISHKRTIKVTKIIASILGLDIDLKNITSELNKFAIAYDPEKSQYLLILHFITNSKYRIIIRIPDYLKQDIVRLTQLPFEQSTYTINDKYNISFSKDIDFSKGSNHIIECPSEEYIKCFSYYKKIVEPSYEDILETDRKLLSDI